MAHSFGYLVETEPAGRKGEKEQRLNGLTSDQRRIFRLLDSSPKSTGQIALATGMDCAEIMSGLTILELRGLCRCTGDGKYIALP